MITRPFISISIRKLAISLLFLVSASASAQLKFFSIQKDSIPFFRGFAVSFDLVGLAMMELSDYGQYEGALRINLHDEWFPIAELGYGKANHTDDPVTHIRYKTSAPYFRIGIDKNLLKQKHGPYRLYAGLQWDTSFGVEGEQCSYHWLEIALGADATIWGPLHLGWSVRYKRRLSHKDGIIGRTWYVPGFGVDGDTRLGGTFNVIIDI